ncbi:MAG: hypothetical protein M3322_13605 [Actinomycetota bacterium]|nr:hypothetical protein [Actinomycetota bacterium]
MLERKFERARLTAPARRRIVELPLAQAYAPAPGATSAPGLAGGTSGRHSGLRSTI